MLSNLSTYTGFNDVIIVGEEGTKNYVSKVNKLWDHFYHHTQSVSLSRLLYHTQIRWGWTFLKLYYPEVHNHCGVPMLFSETLMSSCDWANDCIWYNAFIVFLRIEFKKTQDIQLNSLPQKELNHCC